MRVCLSVRANVCLLVHTGHHLGPNDYDHFKDNNNTERSHQNVSLVAWMTFTYMVTIVT